jgi:hypothetical protein
MRRTPGLWHIVLALSLIVMYSRLVEQPVKIWDKRLVPPRRIRQRRNPKRNRERWARRLARQQRRRPAVRKAERRRRRKQVLRHILEAERDPPRSEQERQRSIRAIQSWGRKRKKEKPVAKTAVEVADPLAALRAGRGWIDHVGEGQLWEVLIQVRWPGGPACPRCGERDPQYLEWIDPGYRGGLGRWRCQVCAEAGDPGEGGTFTPLSGTLLDGMRTDIHIL